MVSVVLFMTELVREISVSDLLLPGNEALSEIEVSKKEELEQYYLRLSDL